MRHVVAVARVLCTVLVVGSLACAAKADDRSEARVRDLIRSEVEKYLKQNPAILLEVLSQNPEEFANTIQAAVAESDRRALARQQEAEALLLKAAAATKRSKVAEERRKEFANPYQPKIDLTRPIRGRQDAPVTIVAYTDFQCSYCARGRLVIQEILKEYEGKVRYTIRHMPLEFFPMSMPAAKYFEAIAVQSHDKAWEFYDEVFENQRVLSRDGILFLDEVVKRLGLDVTMIKGSLDNSSVLRRIKDDIDEARRFEVKGTPNYLINGVALRGAYPTKEFLPVIDLWLERIGK